MEVRELKTFQSGDIVAVRSKTGEYVAKFLSYRNEKYAVVEILAVLKHPTQGDLHFPNRVDVPLFHQRRAHAFREKVVVNHHAITSFDGEIPDYESSLKKAVEDKIAALEVKGNEWAQKSIALIKDLEKDYFQGKKGM
jgi:kinase-associated protein B